MKVDRLCPQIPERRYEVAAASKAIEDQMTALLDDSAQRGKLLAGDGVIDQVDSRAVRLGENTLYQVLLLGCDDNIGASVSERSGLFRCPCSCNHTRADRLCDLDRSQAGRRRRCCDEDGLTRGKFRD